MQSCFLIRFVQDILRWHRRVPHTIIIDSDNLDVSPHIVITPPEEPTWVGFCTAQANRVPMQSMSRLVCPPLFAETGRMHSYWELMEMYYPPSPVVPMPCTDTTDDLLSTRLPGVPLVFNHEDFRLSVRVCYNRCGLNFLTPAIEEEVRRRETLTFYSRHYLCYSALPFQSYSEFTLISEHSQFVMLMQ